MSKRLLNALECPNADNLKLEDERTFRNLIIWLETNKIRKAPQAIFNQLKDITSRDWHVVYSKYIDGLGCPVLDSPLEELQWILGYAVQMETESNKNVYLKHAVENLQSKNVPCVVAENLLDTLDFRSQEFANGVKDLAKVLNTVTHPDALITLRALRKVIVQRMSPDCVENPEKYVLKGTPFPIQDADLGFDLHDPVLNQAAKLLRMIYIQDLRDLQTKANELIVAVQTVTANPKTDTKLGKVGF